MRALHYTGTTGGSYLARDSPGLGEPENQPQLSAPVELDVVSVIDEKKQLVLEEMRICTTSPLPFLVSATYMRC